MGVFYNEGEIKKRPGVYQRHSNDDQVNLVGARDGVCAIPVRASWGPVGVVLENKSKYDLRKNYGDGDYSQTFTVPAAREMFDGGASTVYTYRMGTGGKAGTCTFGTTMTATAKYPGAAKLNIVVKDKLGNEGTKEFQVYFNNALVETFNFAVDGEHDGENLIKATKDSQYVVVSGTAATVPAVALAAGELKNGADPTVQNNDYSTAFNAFEPYFYNTIALDVDDEDQTIGLLLQSYLKNAYTMGKTAIAVLGNKSSVAFETRKANAKKYDDNKVVFLAGGFMQGTENKDGVLAICRAAGDIASTPTNQGIVHKTINGATGLCETLTYNQYVEAIESGMLALSMSADGEVWYDSGINTLINPDPKTQDEGWKKIRRTRVRFEIFDRLDRTLAPKVGRVSTTTDGIADIIQSGQRVLDAMANNEGKLYAGASFSADPDQPAVGDSAWFVIDANDIDSLEKIYLHYKFRYAQNI